MRYPIFVLTIFVFLLALPNANAQLFNRKKDTTEQQPAEAQPASLKERLFGNKAKQQDLKADHREARDDYRASKKERKAAAARERAARLRKEAIQAERRATRAEKRAMKKSDKAEKAQDQASGEHESFFERLFKKD
ncbi:MAG: hypothetical protein RIC19_08705 [Phaeodactylibacter sp.]|uniref:hypothetical protein n=1 Tax=Phaeodactylibacter sp. TaxID=1940289 RepID=UPI0032EB7645